MSEAIRDAIKSYSPHARGYFTDQNMRIGVRSGGLIVWLKWEQQDNFSGYVEVGSTLMPGVGAVYHKLEEGK